MTFRVRSFEESDIPALLELMRQLAEFEGYIDEFRVSEADLRAFGLSGKPRFGALVALCPSSRAPVGMAVYYSVPWTYDMRPNLVLKELFVTAEARNRGVGEVLMAELRRCAQRAGASRIRWLVLKDNTGARRFYERMGGQRLDQWECWEMAIEPGQDEPEVVNFDAPRP